MPRNVELEHNSAVPEHVHAITLVRHGRTAYNAQHRLQGQIDIPLDEVGQWQVRQTADALRELYVDRRPDIPNRLVICSDLGRAAATAHAFADPLGLEVHPDIRVRERSFGDWEGIPVEELAQRYPEDYRSWAEFRGGELKYGAEPKEEVGTSWRRSVERLGVPCRIRHGLVRVLAWCMDFSNVADAAGNGGCAWRFRRHFVDAQRSLGAAHSIGDRFHIALAFDGLQSRSRYRRFRGMGASQPVASL